MIAFYHVKIQIS